MLTYCVSTSLPFPFSRHALFSMQFNYRTRISSMKPAPHFQFGLFTLLAAAITAGVLLALNVLPAPVRLVPAAWLDPMPGFEREYGVGWPLPVCPEFSVHYEGNTVTGYSYRDGWKPMPLVLDAGCNLGILWIVVRLFECRARRLRECAADPEPGASA